MYNATLLVAEAEGCLLTWQIDLVERNICQRHFITCFAIDRDDISPSVLCILVRRASNLLPWTRRGKYQFILVAWLVLEVPHDLGLQLQCVHWVDCLQAS